MRPEVLGFPAFLSLPCPPHICSLLWLPAEEGGVQLKTKHHPQGLVVKPPSESILNLLFFFSRKATVRIFQVEGP